MSDVKPTVHLTLDGSTTMPNIGHTVGTHFQNVPAPTVVNFPSLDTLETVFCQMVEVLDRTGHSIDNILHELEKHSVNLAIQTETLRNSSEYQKKANEDIIEMRYRELAAYNEKGVNFAQTPIVNVEAMPGKRPVFDATLLLITTLQLAAFLALLWTLHGRV